MVRVRVRVGVRVRVRFRVRVRVRVRRAERRARELGRHVGGGRRGRVGSLVQAPSMRTTRRLRPRPAAGAPEAASSARARPRRPQSSASLATPPLGPRRRASRPHTGRGLDTGRPPLRALQLQHEDLDVVVVRREALRGGGGQVGGAADREAEVLLQARAQFVRRLVAPGGDREP